MKTFIHKLHYNKQKKFYALKLFLGFASLFYAAFIYVKNFLYKKNILREQKVNAKVICVGNLTTGGVGKTPVVCEIVNYLAQNEKVAIISRGYGGKLDNKKVNLIKDFEKIIITDSSLTGDEPYMLAQNTAKCAILTCANRIKAAKFAIKYLGAKILVLDDGFSNRQLKKDLTFLLVDKEKGFGNAHLLPLGPLREPLSEIKRCDKIVLVDKNAPELPIPDFKKPIISCKFIVDKFYNIKTKEEILPDKEKDVLAFCAIGQPQQFYDYVYRNFDLTKTIDFEDHHFYTKEDIEKLVRINKTLVTTEKDAVKLYDIVKNIDVEIIILKLKTQLNVEELLDDQT